MKGFQARQKIGVHEHQILFGAHTQEKTYLSPFVISRRHPCYRQIRHNLMDTPLWRAKSLPHRVALPRVRQNFGSRSHPSSPCSRLNDGRRRIQHLYRKPPPSPSSCRERHS